MGVLNMSETQLKKILAENDSLQEQLKSSKDLLKVSQASQEIVDYVTKIPDPLSSDWNRDEMPNPWAGVVPEAKKGCCVAL
eukprot:JP437772.1.p2 GENE.JP437772.1~~JP437772.1.p2  ORF type:complete len:81 (-),score=19.64 JP437772.1:295-537(-)